MLIRIINFTFSSPFHFIGVYLILLLIAGLISFMWDSAANTIASLFHKETNNFYVSEKNVDKKFLEELKKYVERKK